MAGLAAQLIAQQQLANCTRPTVQTALSTAGDPNIPPLVIFTASSMSSFSETGALQLGGALVADGALQARAGHVHARACMCS